MGILDKIFGDANEKVVKKLQPLVDQINNLEKKFAAMSDQELREQTAVFKKRLEVKTEDEITPGSYPLRQSFSEASRSVPQSGTSLQDDMKHNDNEKINEILPEAFAVVREASKRTLGQRHYDVQLLGGVVLHQGQIAEMKTGEGKTLVATLPAYLNALTGKGVHIVTVNDYLAKRDAAWMGQIFNFLGLTVGCINHEVAYRYKEERGVGGKEGTSTDLVQAKEGKEVERLELVSRKEAYNCDILYGTNNEFGFDYLRDNMVPSLSQMAQRGLNYGIVDEVDSILIDEARTPLIISAPAEESTEKYYKFAELVGRLKENEDYNIDEKMRAATLTEVGIAKMEKLLGVENIYASGGLSDVHHIEQALKARVLFKIDRDYVVKEGEVIIVDEFTGRLMYGRRYSEGLHQAIEAKEGVKIQRESITMATVTFQNYFRMYKKLSGMTGTALTEAEEFSKIYKLETVSIPTNKPMIRQNLNDLIYKTEIGKFKAVIEEIKRRHKTGQPVLVGTISIEKNEILGEMLEREGIKPQILNAKFHEKEAQIISQAGKLGLVTIATNMAGRGVDIILGGNPIDKEEQKKVLELGGLHIIGTERHEARRIDNQLRGRSGRQGDPGSSQFYVSMEDDLMRIFGGDRMKGLMTTLRVPEDMPIENGMVSKSIESAQRKVEGNNFDIRKHLVEYDDVINKHRETIYRRRREILQSEGNPILSSSGELQRDPGIQKFKEHENLDSRLRGNDKKEITSQNNSLSEMILEMVENEIDQVVIFHTQAEQFKDWNFDEIYQVASSIFTVEDKLKQDLNSYVHDDNKLDKVKARTAICEHLIKLAKEKYNDLSQKAGQAGMDWRQIEKAVLIRSIDMLWVEHLEAMDHMRRGIGLRGYGQRDPLIEYKKEAYRLYNELNNLIQKQVVYSIFKIGDIGNFSAPKIENNQPKQYSAPAKTMEKGANALGQQLSSPMSKTGAKNTDRTIDLVHEKIKDASGKKVGRNDPCPCGSGKKFKRCHGA